MLFYGGTNGFPILEEGKRGRKKKKTMTNRLKCRTLVATTLIYPASYRAGTVQVSYRTEQKDSIQTSYCIKDITIDTAQ